MGNEKQPLVPRGVDSKQGSYESIQHVTPKIKTELHLVKTISLVQAIGIIISNVIGSGIFITSRGVTEYMGSVGASLIMWAAVGIYVLLQAWCYAELACLMPISGGDYAYSYAVLGPLPAFLVAWIHVILIAPSASGAISQTAGLYLAKVAGQEDNRLVIAFIATLVISEYLHGIQ